VSRLYPEGKRATCYGLFHRKVYRCAAGHSAGTDCRIGSAQSDEQEGAVRTCLETIAMILALLGAYFALLPLTV
jgi:hypothetical protein